MLIEELTTDERGLRAREAWARLPHGGHEGAALHVQCARSHHLATVFATPEGAVYRAVLRPRSHGQRDRVDEPHGAAVPAWVFDFLDAGQGADDTLPAWCDCGPRVLSRADLTTWIAAHEGRVVVE